jgi:osmotically-inducible protein OsmY
MTGGAAMKTDTDLQQEVAEEIGRMLGYAVGSIGVLVVEGTVTLTGRASRLVEMWLAEYVARTVAGVWSVTNQMELWQTAMLTALEAGATGGEPGAAVEATAGRQSML